MSVILSASEIVSDTQDCICLQKGCRVCFPTVGRRSPSFHKPKAGMPKIRVPKRDPGFNPSVGQALLAVFRTRRSV